ncbi:hypothetical protein Deipe_0152 [Deinococcus peraridilitoris DSM 19664]|uniref:Uncharacterized protein n=1 Tax=Deinococcus peraridilitoris (strain DSM 19664 / LMG 22246 / CIP 109416 / KR-200) TaxID=937777 RepID=K9ZW18_DEIPD|nr:hypothetical protein Deipe_0152 [Deinococcus peraridilitoris DSM 19664]
MAAGVVSAQGSNATVYINGQPIQGQTVTEGGKANVELLLA